jgi:hypothetical protein
MRASRYNFLMTDAPRQNWATYADRANATEEAWLRGLTVTQRFEMYADLFSILIESRDDRRDEERLENWRGNRKSAARLREVQAFTKLHDFRRERAPPHHVD